MSSRSNTFVVEVVSQRTDCWLSLPRSFVEHQLAHLAGTNAALYKMFYPVEIVGRGQESPNSPTAGSASSSSTAAPSSSTTPLTSYGYAAANVAVPSTKDGRAQVGPQFAKDMGLVDGAEIVVIPTYPNTHWRVAQRIEIVPLNADESEVIERNAYALQNSLMHNLRVVFPNQKVTLRASNGVQATVKVSKRYAEPAGVPCYVLTDGTELLVAVKNREVDAATSEVNKKKQPKKGLLKLYSRAMIANIAQQAGVELPSSDAMDSNDTTATPTLFVHPHSLEALNWKDSVSSSSSSQLTVGLLNVAEIAWQKDVSEDSNNATTTSSPSAEKKTLLTASYVRSNGLAATVRELTAIVSDDKKKASDVADDSNDLPTNLEAFYKLLPTNAAYIVAPQFDVSAAIASSAAADANEDQQPSTAPLHHPTFAPTMVYAKPAPEAQYKTNTSPSVLFEGTHSKCVVSDVVPAVKRVTLGMLQAVHGDTLSTDLSKMWAPLATNNANSDGSKKRSSLVTGNTLLVGPRGCGKSTVAAVAALYSGRHVVAVDCSAPLTQIMESVIAECNVCSPSLLLLDNFDAIASTTAGGGGGGGAPAALSPATDLMIQEWLMNNKRTPNADIIVVATAPSLEELQPSVKLPFCFPRILKVAPALSPEKKEVMMQQLFAGALMHGAHTTSTTATDDTTVSSAMLQESSVSILVDVVSKMIDNFTAADLAGVCGKVSRWFMLNVKPQITNGEVKDTKALKALLDPVVVGPIAATFVPRSQIGIKFLGSGSKAAARPPSWDDAGGLAEAKAALHDVLVLPLKFPKLFSRLPLKTKSGVLLHGPSGCGKTYLLSVAVAAEGLHCIVVNGPEIFGKYIGTSEQKIREIFESAQAAAPCVVFFDEFDSVAPRRGNNNTGVTDRVVNQLLCYLDGVEGRKDVYVVAATSRPDLIDPALLRPGRLDRQVACPMPNHSDRMAIITAHLRKTIPIAAKDQSLGVTDEDLAALATATDGFTSADIAGLVSAANSQVIQSFFKLSGDTLLAQLADGGGVAASALAASGATADTPNASYTIALGPKVAADAAAEKIALKKLHESMERYEAMIKEEGGVGRNKNSTKGSPDDGDEEAGPLFPKVKKDDILKAMEKFSRSRESQNNNDDTTAAASAAGGKRKGNARKATHPNAATDDEELLNKIRQLQTEVGTRETSA